MSKVKVVAVDHSTGTTSAPWWRFPSARPRSWCRNDWRKCRRRTATRCARRRRTRRSPRRPLARRNGRLHRERPKLTADDCEAVAHWRAARPAEEGRRVIAVNNSWQRAPFADALFAMDRKWWLEYAGRISGDFEFWTSSRSAAAVWKLNLVNSEPGAGEQTQVLDQARREQRVSGGRPAMLFGAARVILLGYDMGCNGEQKHWHPDHPTDLGNPPNATSRRGARTSNGWRATVPIINATRQTALKCFPRMDLETCFG